MGITHNFHTYTWGLSQILVPPDRRVFIPLQSQPFWVTVWSL